MKQISKRIGSLLLSVCLVISMFPTMTFAVDVTSKDITDKFTDQNFLAELRSQLHKGDDVPIYDSDISGITSLYVIGKNITSLAGIEYFTNLTFLSCGDNQLTSLDISGLSNLTTLSCSYNQLTSLDVSGLISLSELDCSNNQLTSLNVSGLNNLAELDCQCNKLTNLDISGLNNLTELYCTYNELTSLKVSGLSSLSQLYCYNNQLTSLDVSGLNSLTILLSDHNQLTNLDVSDLNSLTVLDCSNNNQLTNLNVSDLNSLTKLNCNSNQLTNLDISGLNSLLELNCSLNQLTNLDVSGLSSLTELWCAFNNLTSLDVSDLNNLAELWCQTNKLSTLDVSGLNSLSILNCYDNKLTNLDVSGLSSLTTLNCNNNYMSGESAIIGLDKTLTTSLTVDPQRSVSFYSITVQNDGNGTANANTNTSTEGTEITLTTIPNSGYKFKEWIVISGGVNITDNKFIMPDEDVIVKAIMSAYDSPVLKITKDLENSYNVTSGSAIKLEIEGKGIGDLSYQWYSNSDRSYNGTKIHDATSNSYTIQGTISSAIYYYVEMSADNSSVTGSTTSSAILSNIAKVNVVGTNPNDGDDNDKPSNSGSKTTTKAINEVSTSNKGIEISLSSDEIDYNLSKNDIETAINNGGEIKVSSQNMVVTMPPNIINLTSGDTIDVKIGYTSETESMTRALKESGYTVTGKPFKVEVKKNSTTVKGFDGYMFVVLDSDANNVMMYENGKLSPVPTYELPNGKIRVAILENQTLVQVSRESVSFIDTSSHWANNIIKFMASRGIISGKGNGTFDPQGTMTRGEVATIMSNALGLYEKSSASFSDVSSNDWFNSSVNKVNGFGLMSGRTNGFEPNANLTRFEAMTLIARTFDLVGINSSITNSQVNSILSEFNDFNNVPDWARKYVALCVKEGIISGKSGNIAGDDTITRAEMTTIVYRLLIKSGLINE